MRRRAALQKLALLGAATGFASWPVRAANARAGFVYVGPRRDWGWNESHAITAPSLARLAGATSEASVPESTDYDSGKDTPETRAYTQAIEGLIAGGTGLVFSTSVGHDPFLRAAATQHPEVAFRQVSLLPMEANPANLGSQNALINQGHFVNGVAAGLCTRTNRMGFVAGLPFGSVLLNVNSFLLGCRRTNPKATVQVIFTGGWGEAARAARHGRPAQCRDHGTFDGDVERFRGSDRPGCRRRARRRSDLRQALHARRPLLTGCGEALDRSPVLVFSAFHSGWCAPSASLRAVAAD